MRDITLGVTIYAMFTTRQFSTGAPFALAGTPVISAYENDSATQITAGVSVSASHDGVTGLNLITVVATSGNGFESGKDYHLVITTGTVDGISVVGEVVGSFSIERSAAAVDLANGTDGLGAIKTDTAAILVDTGTTLQAELDAIEADVDAILVDTSTTLQAELDAIQAAVITNAAGADIAADIIALKAVADAVLVDTGTTLQAEIDAIEADVDAIKVTTDKLDDTLEDDAGTFRFTANALEQGPAGEGGGGATAQEVWEYATRELTAGTNIVLAKGTGVTGFTDLSAAQVNAECDTAIADAALATAANLATVAGYLDTEVSAILADTNELQTDLADGGRIDLLVDAIKAKTDSLSFTVAGQVDANTQYVNDTALTGDGSSGTPWGPA